MKHHDRRLLVLVETAWWFLRIEDGPLSKAEKSVFLAWLRSSPSHVVKYLSAARVARYLPVAFKEGPIRGRLIDTLLDAVPEQLDESERRTAAQAMLETLQRRLNQSDSPLPVAIRRKDNGVSRDSHRRKLP